jgi:hypothetical protein
MARKTDPRLAALRDELAKARAEAERWYARLKRALIRLDKARRKAARVARRIESYTNPTPKEVATP